mmetsp:Transcript_11248/g.28603  ORF Transcript_11248/g.28603 Transcript_11248/m.28603 type:complete len:339 (+) Transcript_11248:183-1199(+)
MLTAVARWRRVALLGRDGRPEQLLRDGGEFAQDRDPRQPEVGLRHRRGYAHDRLLRERLLEQLLVRRRLPGQRAYLGPLRTGRRARQGRGVVLGHLHRGSLRDGPVPRLQGRRHRLHLGRDDGRVAVPRRREHGRDVLAVFRRVLADHLRLRRRDLRSATRGWQGLPRPRRHRPLPRRLQHRRDGPDHDAHPRDGHHHFPWQDGSLILPARRHRFLRDHLRLQQQRHAPRIPRLPLRRTRRQLRLQRQHDRPRDQLRQLLQGRRGILRIHRPCHAHHPLRHDLERPQIPRRDRRTQALLVHGLRRRHAQRDLRRLWLHLPARQPRMAAGGLRSLGGRR